MLDRATGSAPAASVARWAGCLAPQAERPPRRAASRSSEQPPGPGLTLPAPASPPTAACPSASPRRCQTRRAGRHRTAPGGGADHLRA
eukprot:4541137-Prymnesium_polylepis.1